MNKREIATWLKPRVGKKLSPAQITIEYFVLYPEDFKKLIELLEEENE